MVNEAVKKELLKMLHARLEETKDFTWLFLTRQELQILVDSLSTQENQDPGKT